MPRTAGFLLLPVLPAVVQVLDDAGGQWSDAADWWGLPRGPVEGPGGVALAGSAEAGAASGAHSVLLHGPDPRGLLAAAGYRTRTWRGVAADAGALALVAEDGPRLHPPRPGGLAGLKRAGLHAVRQLAGPARLTVASRTAGPPALCAAQQATAACVVTGGGGPRRRQVMLVGDSGRATRVVKAARPADADRAAREQEVLTVLHQRGSGAAVPAPLGHGLSGPFAWSAESALPGRPLADLLGERGARPRVRQVLDEVAAWLGTLAASHRTARSWGVEPAPGAVLLGEHAALAPAFGRLDGVPGVPVHGDLGAAFNLLVDDDGSWGVLDWETAQLDGLPLLDLLPLLCGALASLEGRDTADRAEHVLRLCSGQAADSDWLLTRVSRYVRDAGIPGDAAGALAALAFGHQASMRLAHTRLVQDAGEDAPQWRSLWDDVARGWGASPLLGWDWPALREHRSRTLG